MSEEALTGKRGDLQDWLHFLRAEGHVLKRRPALVWQQAANYPEESAVGRRAAALQAAGRWSKPWLKMLERGEEGDGKHASCLMTLTGHTKAVGAVAISSDGRRIASGGDDETLKGWDAESGRELFSVWVGMEDKIHTVLFTPDGRRVVWAGAFLSEMRDAETGERVCGLTSRVSALAVSADGQLVIAGTRVFGDIGDPQIVFFDASSGKKVLTLQAHADNISALAVTPDSRGLVSGSEDKTIKIWDVATGAELQTLSGHESAVRSVAVAGEGRFILSGDDSGVIKVWDAVSGAELGATSAHEYDVDSPQVLPDGKSFLSLGRGGGLKILEVETVRELKASLRHLRGVNSAAILDGGHWFVTGETDGTVRVWRMERSAGRASAPVATPFARHENLITGVELSDDLKRVLSYGPFGFNVWDVTSGRQICSTSISLSMDFAATLSPDGRRVISAGEDKTLWDASAGVDKTPKVWDVETGGQIGALVGHEGEVCCVAVTPDDRRIVTADSRGMLKVWDAHTHRELMSVKGSRRAATGVAAFPDGRRVLETDGSAFRIFDVEAGELLPSAFKLVSTDSVSETAVSPDGQRVAAIVSHGLKGWSIKVWETYSGRTLHTLEGHEDRIHDIAWTSDGLRLVSGGWDGAVVIWDAETGVELTRHFFTGKVLGVATRDALVIAGVQGDGDVYLFELRGIRVGRRLVNSYLVGPRHFVRCPYCRAEADVPTSTLGQELDCPSCARSLELQPFPVISLDESGAAVRAVLDREGEGLQRLQQLLNQIGEPTTTPRRSRPAAENKPAPTLEPRRDKHNGKRPQAGFDCEASASREAQGPYVKLKRTIIDVVLLIVALGLLIGVWVFFSGRLHDTSIWGREIRATPGVMTIEPGGSGTLSLWIKSSVKGSLRMEGPEFLTSSAFRIGTTTDRTGHYVYTQELSVVIRAAENASPGTHTVTLIFPHNRALLEPWGELATQVQVHLGR